MNEHMAIDQYGNTFHGLGPYPRKELLNRLGRKHADKMYRDRGDWTIHHVGWVIGGHWLSVFEVKPINTL